MPETRPYHTDFWDFCGDAGLCIKIYFCSCFVYGEMQEKLGSSYASSCIMWSCCSYCLPCFLNGTRNTVRNKYNLQDTGLCEGCIGDCCCWICSMQQLSREIDYRNAEAIEEEKKKKEKKKEKKEEAKQKQDALLQSQQMMMMQQGQNSMQMTQMAGLTLMNSQGTLRSVNVDINQPPQQYQQQAYSPQQQQMAYSPQQQPIAYSPQPQQQQQVAYAPQQQQAPAGIQPP
eukprot:Awhi_evm1s6229